MVVAAPLLTSAYARSPCLTYAQEILSTCLGVHKLIQSRLRLVRVRAHCVHSLGLTIPQHWGDLVACLGSGMHAGMLLTCLLRLCILGGWPAHLWASPTRLL